ncbi:MAG: exosome complex exonuclease Rrp41 [Candidatus Micrarchaeota archaeon]|nr:exosome complex exonuclease Rrp41 [Candidatus Micrarchaeota archaeon]
MKAGAPEKLIIDGKRLDGRGIEEMREIEARIGVLKRADGSAFFRFGNTRALAAVYGPRQLHPKYLQDPKKALIRCKYNMAPFSSYERIRPGVSRRSIEISKILTEALSQVVFVEEFPRAAIDVFVEIIQADASTRCAALNAAALALADAGIPMKDLVSSCAAGKVDGEIILDVAGLEDNYGEVDMPVAMTPRDENIVLLQIDGILTKEEFEKALDLARKGCKKVYEAQKAALKEKYIEVDEDE